MLEIRQAGGEEEEEKDQPGPGFWFGLNPQPMRDADSEGRFPSRVRIGSGLLARGHAAVDTICYFNECYSAAAHVAAV